MNTVRMEKLSPRSRSINITSKRDRLLTNGTKLNQTFCHTGSVFAQNREVFQRR